MNKYLSLLTFCILLLSYSSLAANLNKGKPNIVLMYFDDLGFGDVGAYQATGNKYSDKGGFLNQAQNSLTPNLDQFAAQGLKFTHAHSASGVCTPSRYALLTGEYAWRTSLKKGVTQGYSPSIMPSGKMTIASMLQQQGYQTAMVGKWHIGMQFYGFDGKPVTHLKQSSTVLKKRDIDFSKPLTDTPYHVGFDYYFGTSASLDMPPYAWIESDAITGKVHVLNKGAVTSGEGVDFSQASIAKNSDFIEGVTGEGGRQGVKDPHFKLADYLEVQAAKVEQLVAQYRQSETPFFIYIPVPAPHTPHAVQSQFQGLTGFKYGDYLVQTDYYAGRMLKALGDISDPNSLASNTLVLITSDNGPEIVAQRMSLQAKHDPNGPFKGIKRDNWEGGTRVPFMLRWPNKVKPGQLDKLVWQGDFMATVADHLNAPELASITDGQSFLLSLNNKKGKTHSRPGIIEHSSAGQFAIIEPQGIWKLIDGSGSGGSRVSWDQNDQLIEKAKGKIGKGQQLYNLALDPGETNNLLVDDLDNPNDNHEPSEEALVWAKKLNQGLNQIRSQTLTDEKGE